jgi:phage terminase large subunit GpA-like protein
MGVFRVFRLTDAWQEESRPRTVFKFRLELIGEATSIGESLPDIEHSRIIPTAIKLAVWKRDGGRCIRCGSRDNLHFDHDIPYSKGGSSLVAENIQLLCARHNLEKRDHIS